MKKDSAALLTLTLLILIFFAPLFFPQLSIFVTPDFGLSDILHFNYPLHEFFARELKQGHFPLWTNLIGTGFPIFAESQEGFFNLIKILTALIFPPAVGFNLLYVISFWLMAVFTYGFVRLLGLNRLPSFLAATVFTFSAVNITHIAHTNQVLTQAFLPLQFFLLEKYLQTKKIIWLPLLSIAVGQAIVAGKFQVEVYVLLALIFYFLFRWLKESIKFGEFEFRILDLFRISPLDRSSGRPEIGRRSDFGIRNLLVFKPLLLFAFSLALGFGLSMVQFLPSLELTSQSFRQGGLPLSEIGRFPFPPQHLLSFLNPYWFGDPRSGTYPPYGGNWGIFWENTGYVGLVPLGLALLVTLIWLLWSLVSLTEKFKMQNSPPRAGSPPAEGRVVLWRLAEKIKSKIHNLKLIVGYYHATVCGNYWVVGFFAFLTISSVLLAMGKYTPLFALFKFPPFSYFRVPSRFLVLTDFSLAILAGFGLQKISNWRYARFLWNGKFQISNFHLELGAWCLVLLALFDLWSFGFNYNPRASIKDWLEPPTTIQFLKTRSEAPKQGATSYKVPPSLRLTEVGSVIPWNQIFMTKGWQNNLSDYPELLNSLKPSLNLLYDIPSSGAYVGLQPERLSNMIGLLDALIQIDKEGRVIVTEAALKILSLQNVKYIISPFFLHNDNLKLIHQTQESKSSLNFFVFENNKVLPRVYPVSHFRLALAGDKTLTDFKIINSMLIASDFDPTQSVILEKMPLFDKADSIEGSSAQIVEDRDESVKIQASMTGSGFLVLADSYYPGWKAFVDGKEVEIFAANLNQRAVVAPRGEHKVEFIYQPTSFKRGLIVTLTSFSLILGWFLFEAFKFKVQSSKVKTKIQN